LAAAIIACWEVTANLEAKNLLTASDGLNARIKTNWHDAKCHREYPVALLQENGNIVSGFIDLLLDSPDGFVIIDQKSFPGSREYAAKKAATFAGQLGSVRRGGKNSNRKER
jgi:ATP-dependent helicase/nuclease subunit A